MILQKIKFLGKKISCPHYDFLDFTYGKKKVIKSNSQKDYLNPDFVRKNYLLKILFKLKRIFHIFFKNKRLSYLEYYMVEKIILHM